MEKISKSLILIFFLSLLIITLCSGKFVKAQEEFPTLNFDLSEIHQYSGLDIYQEREITDTFTHTNIFIKANNFSWYSNSSRINLNWNFVDEDLIISNLKIKINEKEYSLPFLEPSEPLQIIIGINDQISISYNSNKKMTPLIKKFWYPYDSYHYDIWGGAINKIPLTIGASVYFPESFCVKEAHSSAPLVLPQSIIKSVINKTSNEVISTEEFVKITLVSEMSNLNQTDKCQSYDSEGRNYCISPPLFVSPKDLILRYNFDNLTKEDLNGALQSGKTGYYLDLKLGRNQIIQYFFWISVALIISSCIYFELKKNKEGKKLHLKKKLYLAYKDTFVIWGFQEGIVVLTSLSRPLQITIFDLTILLPLVFFLGLPSIKYLFYHSKIIIKKINNLIRTLLKC